MVRPELDDATGAKHAAARDQRQCNALVGAPTLPLTNFPVFNFGQLPADAQLTASIAPYYLDWLAHPDYDAYWKQWSIEEHYSKIAVPHAQRRRLV